MKDIKKDELLKLIDICDAALFLLDKGNTVSFDTFNHGEIDTKGALEYVDFIFQKIQ